MTSISISKLKENPSKIIALAEDYPVEIVKRNKTEAYLVGKEFYEKLINYFEDIIDAKAVEEYNPSEAIPFEKVVKELNL